MWGNKTWSVCTWNAQEIVIAGLAKSPVKFRPLFLRDGCFSNGAVDTSTRQKTFTTPQIANSTPLSAQINNNNLVIRWSDGHLSSFDRQWLGRYASLDASLKYRCKPQKWISWTRDSAHIQKVSFEDYMNKTPEFFNAVTNLAQYGILQVTDIPDGESHDKKRPTVEQLATIIGNYPKTTFYGTSWNVKSVKQARNVAYTSAFLPLHMDLLYYESPPGIQLLHVIENSVTGGESYFADSYAAALHIRDTDQDAYNALCTVPLSYHYVNDGQHYFQMRSVIVTDPYTGEIDHLNYSPPFQAPLDAVNGIDNTTFDAFVRGLQAFERFVEAPENQIQFRMEPGTCIIFYNRRALHARREFDSTSGSRWFKGTYTDIDAFNSTIRCGTEMQDLVK